MNYQDYGFIPPRGGIASTADEAATLAASLGFPVAMKIVSPDLLHKTDVGGVEMGLTSEAGARAAFSRILSNVGKHAPQARIDGVRVEEMCQEGTEIIIGLNNDKQFGPVVMFGLGGVYTEVLHDVSFRVLPITRTDAQHMIQEIKGRRILEGYRGQPPVSTELLIDLLMKASHMGLDMAYRLESVDLNPVMVWGDQHLVLDAKILLRPEATPVVEKKPDTSYLDTFFKARSVAVIGASATPGKIGNSVLDSLARHEYKGKVYPVNPGRDEVMGLKSFPTLSSIPETIDLVVVTVALSAVPDLIRECATKDIHNMVIISGGGKELGGASQELEATIKRLAGESDLRIVGCNCIGVFDGETRLDTFFQIHERMARPRNGSIAMLTQSGTVGAAFLEAAEAVGVSKFVSYGNRTDVDEADLITYLADDPSTKVIACYVEGFEAGRKFLFAGREVSRKKPVVIYKAARTRQAASAAISHTGFFGGTYGVVEGALKQAGLIAVDSVEELYAVAKALALQPRARGTRAAMISNGAGTMIQAMDLFESYGLQMASLSAETVARLKDVYPSFYLVQNPIDVTGSATSADYEVGIEALMQDPQVDIVMPWFVFQDTPLGEDIVQKVRRLTRAYDKPLLVGAIGGPYTIQMSRALEAEGVPVYDSVRDWVAAARGAAHNHRP